METPIVQRTSSIADQRPGKGTHPHDRAKPASRRYSLREALERIGFSWKSKEAASAQGIHQCLLVEAIRSENIISHRRASSIWRRATLRVDYALEEAGKSSRESEERNSKVLKSVANTNNEAGSKSVNSEENPEFEVAVIEDLDDKSDSKGLVSHAVSKGISSWEDFRKRKRTWSFPQKRQSQRKGKRPYVETRSDVKLLKLQREAESQEQEKLQAAQELQYRERYQVTLRAVQMYGGPSDLDERCRSIEELQRLHFAYR